MQPIHTLRTFPALQTDRFELRRLTLVDADSYFETYSNPEMMADWGLPPHRTVEQTARLIAELQEDFDRGESIRWGLALKSTQQLIGDVGFWPLDDPGDNGAEVGIKLLPAFWGRGIMLETLTAALDFGFEHMGLETVEALVHPDNLRALYTVLRLGFGRSAQPKDGSSTGTLCLSQSRWQWMQRNGSATSGAEEIRPGDSSALPLRDLRGIRP